MKILKKLLEVILLVVCVISLMAACSEYPEHQFIWSMGWMTVMSVSAHILDRMGYFKRVVK